MEDKGFEVLALRYLYLTAHYRDTLNFTWESMSAAQNALNNLREQVLAAKLHDSRTALSQEKEMKVEDFSTRFSAGLADDLNTPKALAVLWEALKSNIPSEDKYDLAVTFDEVLGLKLSEVSEIKFQIPQEIKEMIEKREKLRKAGNFEESDRIREDLESKGYQLEDKPEGPKLTILNKN